MTAGSSKPPGSNRFDELLGDLPTVDAADPSVSRDLQVSLMLYHADGAEVILLDAGVPVVIGRGLDADVVIRDRLLSRQHARFTLQSGVLQVEDLASHNGTWVGGERVKERRLTPGDEVVMGGVTASVHLPRSAEAALPGGLPGHDRFVELLEREVDRARAFGRSLGLLMLRPESTEKESMHRWVGTLKQRLRTVDAIGVYGPDTVEVALPEVDRGALRDLMAACGTVRLVGGAALVPDCATSTEELLAACLRALQRASASQRLVFAEVRSGPRGEDLTGADEETPVLQNAAMRELDKSVSLVADAAVAVLIVGETGTGKEVIARLIHQRSRRRRRPLRCINCGAIPKDLVESVLFGHERGAFSGATQQTKGVFEEADGGIVLLDEIGELPAAAQVALLRVLETKAITRVGSNREISLDVRIIAATHRDLEAMCEAGAFRQDLLYRLNTMTLEVPPLRERSDEIASLAQRFIAAANRANGCQVEGIASEALEVLERHGWPGNVRELRNVIERAVILARSGVIMIEELPQRVRQAQGAPAATPARRVDTSTRDFKAQVSLFEASVLAAALEQTAGNQTEAARLLQTSQRTISDKVRRHRLDQPNPALIELPDLVLGDASLKEHVIHYEIDLIRGALAATEGNKSEAARRLQIPLRTMTHKIRSYGI